MLKSSALLSLRRSTYTKPSACPASTAVSRRCLQARRHYAVSHRPRIGSAIDSHDEYKSALTLSQLADFLLPVLELPTGEGRHQDEGHSEVEKRDGWNWKVEERAMELEDTALLKHKIPRHSTQAFTDERAEQCRSELFAALRVQDAPRLLSAVLAAFEHPAIIQSLSPTSVHEILRSTDLGSTIEEYHRIASLLSPKAITMATASGSPIRQITHSLDNLHQSYAQLVRRWQEMGEEISDLAYKQLLQLAAHLGSGESARMLRDMIKQSGKALDLDNTNAYLRAICWANSRGRNEHKLRIASKNVGKRKSGYSDRPDTHNEMYQSSLKQEASDAFQELIDNGYPANAETFSLLALSMGRVGDLDGIAGVLDQIWDVKVADVMNREADTLFENELQRSSPFYPTPDVLYTIAHIYGTNNQLPQALKLVDHISTRYDIEMTQKVWEELARWCFVLSTPRREMRDELKRQRYGDEAKGHVSGHAMDQFFETMRSHQHRVKPTLAMWNWCLKGLFRARATERWIYLFKDLAAQLQLQKPSWPNTSGELEARTGAALTAKEELGLMDELARSVFVFRWIRLMLSTKSHNIPRKSHYYYKAIPKQVLWFRELWCQNTTKAMHYRIPSGRLQFHRGMLKKRLENFEISAIAKGLTLVRPLQHQDALPFVETTFHERRNNVAALEIRSGEALDRHFHKPSWYEDRSVQDWLWFSDGSSALVSGGTFRGRGRNFQLPAEVIDSLPAEQKYELQRKLFRQGKFTWNSVPITASGQGPAEVQTGRAREDVLYND